MAFWQTKSHAIITDNTVPPDCLERVISQRGEMTIYQRSSTSRLAEDAADEFGFGEGGRWVKKKAKKKGKDVSQLAPCYCKT